MSTELEAVTTQVAKFDAVAAGIKALQEKYTGVIYPVTTAQGMAEAKAARAAIREPRYEVERIRKAAKAPILALGKSLDDRAKRITAALEAIEAPIDQQIKAEEDRKEAERQAKVNAELARVAGHQERIAEIRGAVTAAATCTAQEILYHIEDVEKLPADESFEEFQQQAVDAKDATLARLREMHGAAVQREAEAARIEAERKELEQLRAEQARRDAEERARLAEEARIAREAQEAERAKQQAELEAQRAEQERLAKAERERLAAERAEQEKALAEQRRQQEEAAAAERERIAQERAALAAEQERQRQQREAEEAAKRIANRPSDEEIVAVLAERFKVPTSAVRSWLGWNEKAAA